MRIYSIKAPDGFIYDIKGPEGAAEQDLFRAAQAAMREREYEELQRRAEEVRNRPAPPPETTFFGQVKEAGKGVIPGAVGLLESAGTGISALLPEETEKSAREAIKNIATTAKAPFEAAPGYEQSFGRQVGEGIGSLLPMAPLAFLGPVGIGAGVGLGVASGAGEARTRAEQAGATEEERATATGLGTLPGAMDAAVDMALAAFPGGAGKAIGIIKRAAMSGGIEGATEAAQSVAQNAIAQGVYAPEQELVEGAGDAATVGGAVGVLASLLLDAAIPGRRGKVDSPPAPDEETTPETSEQLFEETTPETSEQLLLGYTPTPTEPFTPVVTPEGETLPTQEAYDEYRGVKTQQAEDRRTADPMASMPADMREMARGAKQSALEETFDKGFEPGQMGIPGIERGGPSVEPTTELKTIPMRGVPDADVDVVRKVMQDEFNATVDPETGDLRVAPEDYYQATLALQGVAPEAKLPPDTLTRDMVDELESADIESMVRKDESEELRQLLAEEQVKVDKALRARGVERGKKEATEQAQRMQILLPIIALDTPNIEPLFVKALKKNGIPQVTLTQREQEVIGRAYDLRALELPGAEVSTKPLEVPSDTTTTQGAPTPTTTTGELAPVAGDVAEPTGAGVGGVKPSVQPGAPVAPSTGTPRVKAPKPGGLGDTGQLVPSTEVREVPTSGALTTPVEPTAQVDNIVSLTERLGDKVSNSAMDRATKQEIDSQLAELIELGKQNRMTFDDLGRLRQATGADNLMRASFDLKKLLDDIKRRPSDDIPVAAPTNVRSAEPAANDVEPTAQGPKPLRFAEPKAEPKAKPEAEPKAKPDTVVDDVAFDAYAGDGEMRIGKQLKAMKDALAKGELPKNVVGKTKAAYDKLSPEQQAQVRAQIEKYIDNASSDVNFLDKKDAAAISAPLHPAVVSLIRENNLVGALQFIAGMRLGRVSDIARQMSTMLDGVSIKIVDLDTNNPIPLVAALFKKDPSARGVAGAYLASSKGDKDIILLDKNKGLDIWTLLHEGTHALVDNTLNKANHPLTKQLTQLFEQVKPSLGSAYGATDVKEFAAEARSNPEFQRTLGMIDVGADVSAMAKFVHSVKNFMRGLLGMPQKPMTSALDAVDKLVESIIAGRDGVSRTEGDISFLRKPGETYSQMSQRVLNTIGERTKKLPGLTPERIGAIHEMFFTKIGGGTKEIIRQFLPLHSLCEVATKEIPMAMRLERLVGEKTNDENGRNQEIEQTVKMVDSWARKHPKLVAVLNRVVYKSTEVEVDPSDLRSHYEKFWMSYETKGGPQQKSFDRRDERDAEVKRLNKEATDKHKAAGGEGKLTVARATGDKNPDKLTEWDKMQADWNALGDEGQATYNRMRDSYKTINEQLRDALDARIDATVEDPNVRTRLKNELYEKLFASGVIRPYFPLLRRGDHWLVYEVNGIQNVEAFESTYERTLAVERLAKDTAVTNVQEMPKPTSTNYKTAPAPAFVRDVLQSLSANKVDSKVSEEIMRLFLDSLPESSFAHSLRSRKGTPGFTVDALDAFRTKPYSIARQISNMKYGAKFEALRSEMRDYVKTKNNTQVATDYYNELSERIDFAISPNVPEWSKIARSAIYGYTLGLNVSSALIGLVQVPQLVAPYLAGPHGVVNTTRAIGRAMKHFTNSGTSHTVSTLIKGEKVTVPAGPSLDNYDFTSKDAPKHLETLVRVARERGQMSRSQTYDMLGQSDGVSVLTKINAVSGFMQHHTERMARQVTLAAAYELKLQDLVGKGKKLSSATAAQQQQAAEYAVDVSELTVGGTSAAAAPRIAQGAIGSVVMMYKRYGIQMYYTLFRTAKQALFTDKPKGMSDAEFKQFTGAAQRQVVGICAMTLLLAGVQGIPMIGMVAMLYNLIVPEEDEDDFDTAARKFLKEGMYSGALNALTGSEVAARISLSDLIFRDSMTPFSEDPLMSFVEFVGGPAVGVTNRVIRGVQNINEGEIQRGIEQILPSAVGNAMKSVRYATEGITTARGDPIVEDVGPMTLGAQFFGFAPAEYTRQLEINSTLKTFDRDVLERRTKLMRQYYVAVRMGDSDGASEITDKILKYNDRYPENAITMATIKKSMEQHNRTSAEMYGGISVSKQMRDRVMRMAEEYEDYEE